MMKKKGFIAKNGFLLKSIRIVFFNCLNKFIKSNILSKGTIEKASWLFIYVKGISDALKTNGTFPEL
jgi:uncharacterized membrane protein